MSKKKKVLIVIFILIIAIQFIPTRNNNGQANGANDINNTVTVPAEVAVVLNRACYDCHSNHTNYKWYCYLQPLGAWIEHHINEGKDELNFSEFKTYKLKRQAHKLKEVVEMLEEKEMPLSSYLIIHEEAKLSKQDVKLLVDWANTTKAKIDSLIVE